MYCVCVTTFFTVWFHRGWNLIESETKSVVHQLLCYAIYLSFWLPVIPLVAYCGLRLDHMVTVGHDRGDPGGLPRLRHAVQGWLQSSCVCSWDESHPFLRKYHNGYGLMTASYSLVLIISAKRQWRFRNRFCIDCDPPIVIRACMELVLHTNTWLWQLHIPTSRCEVRWCIQW